jgi:hypothetical protein
MIILEELEEQEMILSIFNKSEDPLFNNKIIEISILLINFDRNKYELFFMFIH